MSTPPAPGSREEILIVDDDPDIASLLQAALSSSGFPVQVYVPTDGRLVIDEVRRRLPRLLVLDVNIPGMDGLSICRRVKDDPALAAVKVVIFTSKGFEQDRLKALRYGADEFLAKGDPIKKTASRISALASRQVAVRFWGVRGSLPTPGPGTARYGGNTSCVEVRAEGQTVVFDAGTGIRELGAAILREHQRPHIHLCLTHFHWDHIHGLPFFPPAYVAGAEIDIYGAEDPDLPLKETIANQMESVYFPIPLRHMAAEIRFHPISEGAYSLGRLPLKTLYLNHPGNALGYRLECEGKAVVYMTDNELDSSGTGGALMDPRFIAFCKGADLLVHDAQYTDGEYPTKKGWGHSTQGRVLDLAASAGVRRCALFHHDPDHTDEILDGLLSDCRRRAGGSAPSVEVDMASEGLEILL